MVAGFKGTVGRISDIGLSESVARYVPVRYALSALPDNLALTARRVLIVSMRRHSPLVKLNICGGCVYHTTIECL
jgi:hypothetical protein